VAATEGSTTRAATYSTNGAGSPVVPSTGLRNTIYTYEDSALTLVMAADEYALNDGLLANSTKFDQLGRPQLAQQNESSSSTFEVRML
jgi:hypothetical protein